MSNLQLTAAARVLNTQWRVGFGVSNKTNVLLSYDPVTHEFDTVALPPQVPEGELPLGGTSVIVRELKMAYYIGAQGGFVDVAAPTELFAFNYSDNSIVRKPMPATIWATVNYIRVGQKDILIMLGGMDAVHLLPVSGNSTSPAPSESLISINPCCSCR